MAIILFNSIESALEPVGNCNQTSTQPKLTGDQLIGKCVLCTYRIKQTVLQSLLFFLWVDKPNPSELFQRYFSDLCDVIGTEANFDRTIDKLFAQGLITQAVYDDIDTTPSYSVYKKGKKTVRELQKQIISSANPDKILLKICEILLSIDDKKLKKTVMKLKKQLSVSTTIYNV